MGTLEIRACGQKYQVLKYLRLAGTAVEFWVYRFVLKRIPRPNFGITPLTGLILGQRVVYEFDNTMANSSVKYIAPNIKILLLYCVGPIIYLKGLL